MLKISYKITKKPLWGPGRETGLEMVPALSGGQVRQFLKMSLQELVLPCSSMVPPPSPHSAFPFALGGKSPEGLVRTEQRGGESLK